MRKQVAYRIRKIKIGYYSCHRKIQYRLQTSGSEWFENERNIIRNKRISMINKEKIVQIAFVASLIIGFLSSILIIYLNSTTVNYKVVLCSISALYFITLFVQFLRGKYD